ncbi:hypothetical protein NCC49_006038 [Naganishia albida]|nr:hypothetical protein NCC49_006038 [Naganishia albida]
MKINQPSASIKLTNVSVVRIKKGGKRFEIACYKNKVGEYRSGIEKDVDEVLQIANVFTNVSKGQVAKTSDLQAAFGTSSIPEIVSTILLKGELQVGEKERNHALGNLWKEVAGLVADKVVDPGTKRPYSVSMVEKAMQEVHFNVRGDKSAKSQNVERAVRAHQTRRSIATRRHERERVFTTSDVRTERSVDAREGSNGRGLNGQSGDTMIRSHG